MDRRVAKFDELTDVGSRYLRGFQHELGNTDNTCILYAYASKAVGGSCMYVCKVFDHMSVPLGDLVNHRHRARWGLGRNFKNTLLNLITTSYFIQHAIVITK